MARIFTVCFCLLLCLLLRQSLGRTTATSATKSSNNNKDNSNNNNKDNSNNDVVPKKWVVIVSGAYTYSDYANEATACHLYHIARRGGIPPENIIHFNFDVATGSIENKDHTLVNSIGGENLRPGCEIDYSEFFVNSDLFLNVVTGNKTGTGLKHPKLLESGPNDHVFMALAGNGNKDEFAFGHDTLLAKDFIEALKTMHKRNMYSKMIIKVQSSFSGSMFDGLLPDDMNIYAVSSSTPDENSYNCCRDKTKGVFVGTYFFKGFTNATESSLHWNRLTFSELYEKEKEACSIDESIASHPQEYGDKTLNQLVMADFFCVRNQTSGLLTDKCRKQVTLGDLVSRLAHVEKEIHEVKEQLENFIEA